MADLTGRVGVVTGGSAGIGLATARLLVSRGCAVAVIGRDPDRLQQAVDALGHGGQSVTGIAADLAGTGAAGRVVREVLERFQRLDILVNCAGAAPPGHFDEVTQEQWNAAFSLKVLGAASMMAHAVPHMKARQFGRIVNVTGTAGREPDPWMAIASAVNAALTALTNAAARQLAPHGITVNAVSPGPTDTVRWAGLVSSHASRSGVSAAEADARLRSDMPRGRPAAPQEVADVIAYLASEGAGHVSGVEITVDGSQRRGI